MDLDMTIKARPFYMDVGFAHNKLTSFPGGGNSFTNENEQRRYIVLQSQTQGKLGLDRRSLEENPYS